MRRLFAIVFAFFACAGASADWSLPAMNAQIDNTNFLVNRGCSGTLIDVAGPYILTANHCVDEQYEIVEHDKIDSSGKVTKEQIRVARPGTVTQIYFSGPNEVSRRVYVFKIVATDNDLDLALLKLKTAVNDKRAAPIACQSPARGETVFAVGNPFGVLYSTVTKGIVNSVQRSYQALEIAGQEGDATDNGEHGLLQHTALIAPGNSGGALYSKDGEFVGVNVRGGQGFGFSVPLSDVKKFLTQQGLGKLWSRCSAPTAN